MTGNFTLKRSLIVTGGEGPGSALTTEAGVGGGMFQGHVLAGGTTPAVSRV